MFLSSVPSSNYKSQHLLSTVPRALCRHDLMKIRAGKQREPITALFAEGSMEAQRGNGILPKSPAVLDRGRALLPTVPQGSVPRLPLRQVSLTLICSLTVNFYPLEPTYLPKVVSKQHPALPRSTPRTGPSHHWVAQITQQLLGVGDVPCGTEIRHRYRTQSGLQRYDKKIKDQTLRDLHSSVSILHVMELCAQK